MTKKRKILLNGIGIILVCFFYWFYFSKPGPFLQDKEILSIMNKQYPEVSATTVQDTIFLDKSHVFVPYISESNNYGISYWIWRKHKWKVAYIDTTGQPKTWKISKGDPSKQYIVYNFHPEDRLNKLRFFIIRERNFHVSDGVETYLPRVQMEKSIGITHKSYGVMKIPKEWAIFQEQFIKVEAAKQGNTIFQSLDFGHHMYIGWIPYDQNGVKSFPEKSVNGNGYFFENVIIEHLMILNESELK